MKDSHLNILATIALVVAIYHVITHPTFRNVAQALILGVRDGLV
jgi:hypothetical protein